MFRYVFLIGLLAGVDGGLSATRADCYPDCMGDRGCAFATGSEYTQRSCFSHSLYCTRYCLEESSNGSIAYGVGGGRFGMSNDYSSREAAEERALRECGSRDCEVVVSFKNECAAVATGDGGVVFWGRDYVEGQARGSAHSECVKRGGQNCQVKVSHCSKY